VFSTNRLPQLQKWRLILLFCHHQSINCDIKPHKYDQHLHNYIYTSTNICSIYFTLYVLAVGRYHHGRYRYFWPKISAISISFTAVLFGLLIYFIIVSEVVDDVIVIAQVPFWTGRDVMRCNDVSYCKTGCPILLISVFTDVIFVFKLTLKSRKKYDKISKNYRYFTCHRYDIDISKKKQYLKCR